MHSSTDGRWRRSVYWFSGAAAATFLINLTFTIWAGTQVKDMVDGVGVLLDHRSCSSIKSLNTGFHVIINGLSAVLLAGSNYCMQCLVAPTRKQVDKAHQAGRWLDIGVTSVRNLGRVGWTNLVLWLLLGLSSIPLHLFYNSTILTSTSASSMRPYTLNETILTTTNITTFRTNLASTDYLSIKAAQHLLNEYHNNSLVKLSPLECINAYGAQFQSSWSDVILITKEPLDRVKPLIRSPGLITATGGCGTYLPSQWVCAQLKPSAGAGGQCTEQCNKELDFMRKHVAEWAPFAVKVEYCLALPATENCKLQVNMPLCAVVVVINFFKVVVMLFVARSVRGTPLLTVGDAVTSFLMVEDETTVGMCLKSKEFSRGRKRWIPLSQQFRDVRRFRFVAAGVWRWIICALLFVLAVATCVFFFRVGLESSGGPTNDLMGLGLGTVEGETMLVIASADSSVLKDTLIANVPQLVMSAIYVLYNNILTSICLASEYTDFASERKALRVSSQPLGAQRSAYFLQLPLKFGIPLVAASGAMHWLISQSLYLVKIDSQWSPAMMQDAAAMRNQSTPWRTRYFDPDDDVYVTLGWSPVGVVSVFSGGLLMLAVLVGCGFFKFKTGMPVAGSCSAAISAACHLGEEEKKPWEKEVQWGVTRDGHCSFSSLAVEYPVDGEIYM